MLKFAALLLVMITMSHLKISAQNKVESARHKHIQNTLGMSNTEYRNYRDSLRWYDGRINKILQDEGLKKALGNKELSDLMTGRRLLVQKNVPPGQTARLHQYNMRNRPESPRQKNKNELEKRLKKKGIKMVKTAS